MKIDKYYAAFAVLLAIVLIAAFIQRSDWELDRYILSADNSGNLNPISEKYFKDQEDRIMKLVNDKLKNVVRFNDAIGIASPGTLGAGRDSSSWVSFEGGGAHSGPMIWRDLNNKHYDRAHWKGTLGGYTRLIIRKPIA
tara:strand:- start:35 stop:451 length:417 start_codon:yes stop_codon:yes gene_type:complete